jgi:hypothetical protein
VKVINLYIVPEIAVDAIVGVDVIVVVVVVVI